MTRKKKTLSTIKMLLVYQGRQYEQINKYTDFMFEYCRCFWMTQVDALGSFKYKMSILGQDDLSGFYQTHPIDWRYCSHTVHSSLSCVQPAVLLQIEKLNTECWETEVKQEEK